MKKTICRLTLALSASFAAVAVAPACAQAPAKPAAAASAKPAQSGAQRTFASPEEAVKSLVDAARAADMKAVFAIIGPGSEAWISSGDAVQDERDRQRFLAAYDEKNALEKKDAGSYILAIGADAWPFAVPIVNRSGRWEFDAKAGREEVANRRIGRNELDTIKALSEVVNAQRQYAATDPDGNGIADYAPRFIAREGKKDGLYWPAKPGEAASPLGPLVGLASKEGYGKQAGAGEPGPYRGYLYRILTAQGKDAPGGAQDYLVKGKLTGGFAVVAYPAKYGVSGFMTFIVCRDGVIYQKNLGTATASAAASMTRYNPDKTWNRSQP